MSNRYYHNPRCSKSRAGLQLLTEAGVTFQIKDYLKEGLTNDEICDLSKKLSMHPSDFVRKKEAVYNTLGGDDFSIEQWAAIIAKHPVLLERPVFVCGDKAVIGRPPEQLVSIL